MSETIIFRPRLLVALIVTNLTLSAQPALVAASESAPTDAYSDLMDDTRTAFATDDWNTAIDRLNRASELRPYSLYLQRLLVTALAHGDQPDEAMTLLDSLAKRGLTVSDEWLNSLPAINQTPGYDALIQELATNEKPLGTATVFRAADTNELLPEAVAIAKNRAVFIGSVRSGEIVKLAENGDLEPVAQLPGGVYDLELRDGTLWAAFNPQPPYSGSSGRADGAGIAQIDLRSGAILRTVSFPESDALIGDIEFDKTGVLYASDSSAPRLWSFDPTIDAIPKIFATDPRFANLQGLAYDATREALFVADYLGGLFAIDLATENVRKLENEADAHLGGVDGLYLFRGDLVAIQNGAQPQRIAKIELDEAGTRVTGLHILQRALPDWNEPTHGAVSGQDFIYIATSNWPAYNSEGGIDPAIERKPLLLLKLNLDEPAADTKVDDQE